MSKLLSVIIPARNEKYLNKTVENVLENFEGDSEIIVILDGYWPYEPLKDNDRLRIIHNTIPRGQRGAINDAAKIAQGEYIMKLDAHCAVDKGFDVKLAADCEYDWTVIPRMYNLDINTWQPKLHKRTDYMYIGWNEKNEIRSLYYKGDDWKKWHRKEELIDDTMGCMGPGWFMHKNRFWDLDGCDEDHGGQAGWGQQGIEVACKAWLSGGRLVVNKKTWFAHWFRGDVGFPYEISGKDVVNARNYSKELWLNDKWEKQTRPFQFLLDKFNPPSWENYMNENKKMEIFSTMYKHIHRDKNYATWKGVPILKFPTDMTLYAEAIQENKPEVIVEVGTKYGGSALYFQDMIGDGKVITIDIKDNVKDKDPRIEYIIGDSKDDKIVEQIREKTRGKRTMVVLDGDHSRRQVKWELKKYADIVTAGQYMVVEDCYIDRGLYGPGEARDWFLGVNKDFTNDNRDHKYLIGISMGGWLKKN